MFEEKAQNSRIFYESLDIQGFPGGLESMLLYFEWYKVRYSFREFICFEKIYSFYFEYSLATSVTLVVTKVMNLDMSQLLPLLARLDPGLTKEFLLSSTIPLVLCSSGLISMFNAYDTGFPLSFALLPMYNTISIWRGGAPLSVSILLYNGAVSLHGLVLSIYMIRRKNNAAFVESFDEHVINKSEAFSAMRDANILIKIVNWLGVATTIFLWNAIPYLYTLRGDGTSPSGLLGLSLISLGAVLQAAADHQKQSHKAVHGPDSFCKDGVYRICRHPNYLGEIIFHLGVLISGYSLFSSIPRWLIMGSVPLLMVPMMVFVTKDMADKQENKYASVPSFKDYQTSVSKLVPFVW